MYVENELNRSWKWILGISSALLLLPQLAMPELTGSEAVYGLIAKNANETGNIFSTYQQGHEISHGHLYPWLVNIFGIFGVNEFTIRLPSIMALAIMIAGAAFMTYRYGGRQSAIVAGICMLSTFAAVKMGTRGEEDMFGAAFLAMSWLCWFQMSRGKKNWFKAWLYSLSLVSISAFSVGYYVFILFYLPLLLLRKPTDVRKRVLLLPHFQAIGIMVCIHFIIFLIISNLDSKLAPDLGIVLGETENYTAGLFNFPFTAAILLLPWTFFSWTPFCAAFEAMEKDNVLFHFLRTVTFSMFITYWLIPDSSPISLLHVLPALAIMTGLHYQILVRRYHIYIRKLIRFTLAGLVAINIGLLILFGLKITGAGGENIQAIPLSKEWVLINIAISALSILLAVYLLLKGKFYAVWLKIIFMVLIGHWCIIAFNSLKYEGKSSNKEVAQALAAKIPEGATVYNFHKQTHDIVMFYLDRKIIHQKTIINAETEKLPEKIYVIAGNKMPLNITTNPAYYSWTAISQNLEGEKADFQAWEGTKKVE